MKWSEVQSLVNHYENAVVYNPLNSGMIVGCDCGCGGDSYTSEELYRLEQAEEETIQRVKEFCKTKGIEYDGS